MTQAEQLLITEPAEDSDSEPDVGRDVRPIARFVHQHPGMAIAAGVALGVLAAALIPRRNRKFVAEKSSALADAVSAAGLTLYREALDRAGAAGDGIRDIAGRLGHAAESKAELAEGSAPDDGKSPLGRFDLAEGLASLVRHLRGRSQG